VNHPEALLCLAEYFLRGCFLKRKRISRKLWPVKAGRGYAASVRRNERTSASSVIRWTLAAISPAAFTGHNFSRILFRFKKHPRKEVLSQTEQRFRNGSRVSFSAAANQLAGARPQSWRKKSNPNMNQAADSTRQKLIGPIRLSQRRSIFKKVKLIAVRRINPIQLPEKSGPRQLRSLADSHSAN